MLLSGVLGYMLLDERKVDRWKWNFIRLGRTACHPHPQNKTNNFKTVSGYILQVFKKEVAIGSYVTANKRLLAVTVTANKGLLAVTIPGNKTLIWTEK